MDEVDLFIQKTIRELKCNSMDGISRYRKELAVKPKLIDLFLEVTSRCNAKCEHCGSSCGEKMPKDEISIDYLKKALKEIADAYNAKKIFIYVTGGEPLMRKDIFDLMKYAKKLGFNWGITTNGMLFNDRIFKGLKIVKYHQYPLI